MIAHRLCDLSDSAVVADSGKMNVPSGICVTMCWLYDFTSLALTSMDLDVGGAEIWELFQAFEEFWVIRSSGV